MSITIAFADDHPLLLDGLTSLFEDLEDYQVLASGNSADQAVEIAASMKPDIFVLDLNMPGDAFEAIERLLSVSPRTRVIAFTASADIQHAVRALRAGAVAYVLKGSTHQELLQVISLVLDGETYITPSFASKVIAAVSAFRTAGGETEKVQFSAREDQIVNLLMEGRTNREIGERLNISEKTVKQYMTQLMQKLDVRNRVQAVLAAQQLLTASGTCEPEFGLAPPPDRRRDARSFGLFRSA